MSEHTTERDLVAALARATEEWDRLKQVNAELVRACKVAQMVFRTAAAAHRAVDLKWYLSSESVLAVKKILDTALAKAEGKHDESATPT